jgi:hypothetical protein
VTILAPTIAHLTPVQTVCNYATLWFRNVSSLLSVGDKNGTSQRFIIIATRRGPTTRAARRRRPPTAGVPAPRTTTCTRNPYPEHRLAGPAEGVRGRQRAVPRRQAGHRQRARDPVRDHREDEAAALMLGRRTS